MNVPAVLGTVDLSSEAMKKALEAASSAKAQKVVVVCRTGMISGDVALSLREMLAQQQEKEDEENKHIFTVWHLDGGLQSLMKPDSPMIHFPRY